MKNMLQVLSLVSFLTVGLLAISAQADLVQSQGPIYQCRLQGVQPSVDLPAPFYIYASARATSIARVVFRSGTSAGYAVYIYRSSEDPNQFKLRGELHNPQTGGMIAMTNTSPLSMSFAMDQVSGVVSCTPSASEYAFVNMEASVEKETSEIQDSDMLTVYGVRHLEQELLKQGFIETVHGGGVSNIGSAFQADRTCLTGRADKAFSELRNSSAFVNQDSLTVTPQGLEFRTDRVVGCEQTGVGSAGDVVCVVPKLKKNGALVRVPYCD